MAFHFRNPFRIPMFLRNPSDSQMAFGEFFQSKLSKQLNIREDLPFQEGERLGPKAISKEIGF
jgi:hypothetical protein